MNQSPKIVSFFSVQLWLSMIEHQISIDSFTASEDDLRFIHIESSSPSSHSLTTRVNLRYIHFDTQNMIVSFTSTLFSFSEVSLGFIHFDLKFQFDSFTSTKTFTSIFSLRLKSFSSTHSLRYIPIFLNVALRCCTSTFFSLRYMHFDSSCTSIFSHRFEPIVMYRSAILVEVNGTKCENAYMYRSACQPW